MFVVPSKDWFSKEKKSAKNIKNIMYYKRYVIIEITEAELKLGRCNSLPITIINQSAERIDNIITQYTNVYMGEITGLFPYTIPNLNQNLNMFINREAPVVLDRFAPFAYVYEDNRFDHLVNFYSGIGSAYDDQLCVCSDHYCSPRFYTGGHEMVATGTISKYKPTVQTVNNIESMRVAGVDLGIQRLHGGVDGILDQFQLKDIIDDRTLLVIDKKKWMEKEDDHLNFLLTKYLLGQVLANTHHNSVEFTVKMGADYIISPIKYTTFHKMIDREAFEMGYTEVEAITELLLAIDNRLDVFDDVIPGPLQAIFVHQSYYGLNCHLVIYKNGRLESIPVSLSRQEQHNLLISDDVL